MTIQKINIAVVVIGLSVLANISLAAMPKIVGTPVVDTPQLLQWPTDQGLKKPNLNDPTANTLWDFHGTLDTCDLLLSTEGNYHMALHPGFPTSPYETLEMPRPTDSTAR